MCQYYLPEEGKATSINGNVLRQPLANWRFFPSRRGKAFGHRVDFGRAGPGRDSTPGDLGPDWTMTPKAALKNGCLSRF